MAGAAIAVIGVVVCCVLLFSNAEEMPTESTAPAPAEHIHNYQITETVASTCQKEGYAVYTCECGNSYKAEIEKAGHQFELTNVDERDDGSVFETFTCKYCDEVYVNKTPGVESDTSGTGSDAPTPSTTVSKDSDHQHNYQLTEKHSSTCKEKGYAVYTCTACGEIYHVEMEIVDHNYELTQVVEATPEQDGYEEYTCIYCGKSFRVPLSYTE